MSKKRYDPILIGVTSGKFSKTGKTSFINRFCRNEFSNKDHGQLSACTVKLDDDKTCLVSFIETDSEECLRKCDAVIIMFSDKCWEKDYWNVTYAASEIADGFSFGENIFVAINKTDDPTEVKLESSLLPRPGHLYSLKRRFCSVKTGFGVRDIVNEIIQYVRVEHTIEKLRTERMEKLTKNGVPSVSQEQKDALKQWVKETF